MSCKVREWNQMYLNDDKNEEIEYGGNNMIASLGRINELAKKQREEGLTNAERVEQQVLREDYLREIRGQVLHSISGLTVLDPLGNDVTPGRLREEEEESL